MVILQLYEKIKVPVDWEHRVNHPPFKAGVGHLKKVEGVRVTSLCLPIQALHFIIRHGVIICTNRVDVCVHGRLKTVTMLWSWGRRKHIFLWWELADRICTMETQPWPWHWCGSWWGGDSFLMVKLRFMFSQNLLVSTLRILELLFRPVQEEGAVALLQNVSCCHFCVPFSAGVYDK